MIDVRLYVLQRLSALVMLPFVAGHLAVMIYAIRGGLTAEEILGRTQGSIGWFAFYGLFTLAVAVHGSIGLRAVLREWTSLAGRRLDGTTGLVLALLAVLGLRASWAVTFGVVS